MSDVTIVKGDITRVEADAIVNAANEGLRAGGGVCGAIFAAAGAKALTEACAVHGRCPTGEARTTPAFGIAQARYIVHAVGPVYNAHAPGEADRLLASAYRSAIDEAVRHGCASIAFPAISTGIYGFPLDRAAAIAYATIRQHAADLKVILVAFDDATLQALARARAQHAAG